MAAFTSAKSGNWSAIDTWTDGSAVPGAGDTATIAAGHTVTVAANATIGTSGATGTDELIVTGTLAIAPGVTLTCAGDVLMNANAAWSMAAGSRVEFSGTYRFRYYAGTTMTISGSAGSRCFWGSSSTHFVKFEGQSLYRALTLNASYCDFYRIYDGSTYGPTFAEASKTSFNGCNFNYVGRIRHNGITNNSIIKYEYCKFENSLGTQIIYTVAETVTVAEGNFKVSFCVFKASATANAIYWQTGGVNQVIVEDNVFDDVALQITKNHTFKRNFMRSTLASHEMYDNRYTGALAADAVSDNFYLGESANPHGFRMAGDGQTVTLDGNVSECSSTTADTANHYLPTEQGGDFGTVTIKNAICIGGNAVVIRDMGTINRAGDVIVENLTHAYQAGSGDVLLLSENGGDYAYSGTLTMRNNIEYSTGANAEALVKTYSETIAYSGYNCVYDKTFADRYDSTTVTDGSSNDIAVDPQFVNASANLASWDASIGGNGTNANAVAGFLNREAGYVVADLIEYLRDAFTPTNTALLDGYDGGYIGAVLPVNPDSTAPVLTSPVAEATGPTTSTASVTTDDGNGTLYFLASENATESAATVKAALSQSVTAVGEQSISLSALDPETTYYVHFVQINGASLESASVVSTAAFTTDAIAVKGATITLYAGTTPQASLADIVALWWDATTPSGAPDYSTTTASTDASGVLTLDLDAATALSIGDSGFLLLYKLDATDHRDSLVFAGRVAVSDIA